MVLWKKEAVRGTVWKEKYDCKGLLLYDYLCPGELREKEFFPKSYRFYFLPNGFDP